MILIDTPLAKREADGNPIRIGLVGCGSMGKGVIRTVSRKPGMEVVAIANRTPEHAIKAYSAMGRTGAFECTTERAFTDAVTAGKAAVVADPELLVNSDAVDVVVEVTGRVEFGAQVALACLDAGKDFVTMNVELDATVGYELASRFREKGLVYTVADGDQPGVQMNLFREVVGLGLTPVLCGNIKGMEDPYRTPKTQQPFADFWKQDVHMVTSFADGSKVSMEQACVANATGMSVLERGMRGVEHCEHIDSLVSGFDLEELAAAGGAVEYVIGAEPGPGVFVFAVSDSIDDREYLRLYKRGDGPVYSFYRPYHLCYFEVANSVARAVLFRDETVACRADGPTVEVVTTAKRDLKQGEVLDAIGGFTGYGQCEKAEVAKTDDLLPLGMAEGCQLVRNMPKDTVLCWSDVTRPTEPRAIDGLWDAQQERIGEATPQAPIDISGIDQSPLPEKVPEAFRTK